MSFAETYARSVNSSSLTDDAFHSNCMPLGASGWASKDTSALGMLLLRMTTADGMPGDAFESGARNFPAALHLWIPLVRAKGRARKWCAEHDDRGQVRAEALYVRVGESSLAYFLDQRCSPCEGRGVDIDRCICHHCKGTGIADLLMAANERGITLDLVSDLQELVSSHVFRAKEAHLDLEVV